MVYRQFLFRKLDNLGSLCSSKFVRVRFTAFALLMWLFGLAIRASQQMSAHHGYLHTVYCCMDIAFLV